MFSLIRDWVLDPLGLLFLLTLFCAVLLLRYRRRRVLMLLVCSLWIAGLLFMSAPAVVNPMVRLLETSAQAASLSDDPLCVANELRVVVLGGGVDSRADQPQQFWAMSKATIARVTTASNFATSQPRASFIMVGGGVAGVSEAEMMAAFLERLGVQPTSIELEDNSSNTRENADNINAMFEERGFDKRILLITSALHMSRASGVFLARGFDVCQAPVAPIGLTNVPTWALWPQTSAMVKFDQLLHEAIALMLYRIRGDL